MGSARIKKRRGQPRRNALRVELHPLFLAVGVWYAFKGELFLFLMSCVVAVQHECAHAFGASKLGYGLNKIVLMPFGAIIDGDLSGISLKDEIYVAVCGPLCNLITAGFFVAWWWFVPTVYAFTDTACYSSLAIALVNLLPAYPLDGGRICRCLLTRGYLQKGVAESEATKKAETVCRALSLTIATAFFGAFIATCLKKTTNLSLLAFGAFLFIGAFGNRERASYDKIDFSCRNALVKGVEIKRVAVSEDFPIKDVFRYLSRGAYLVLEVYDERENHLFNLSQNRLSEWFLRAKTPYTTLKTLAQAENNAFSTQDTARKTQK